MSDKPVIFISYSHLDRAWLDYVRSFLQTLAPHGSLLTWDDQKLLIGDDWRGDIYAALDACRIFVLLVSRYSITSKFIVEEEVGRILKRREGEVTFCPIVVTPCPIRTIEWLKQPNRRPPDNKALSELLDPARDREMTVITEQIDELLRALTPSILARPISLRRSFPSIVDYGRLPETPYKKLIGRDNELKLLDDAWTNQTTRVISLIAWGGAGKTSLVIEWLTRVRNDAYRGADAVLCWSFYSQGTQERAAAGEGLLDWALGKLKVKLDTTSSTAKGERLAEELSQRRVLLVLDGLEPLQFGTEGQEGALKEHGLRALLRALATKQPEAGHSLVVITSRLPVHDLTKWEHSTAPKIDLWRLSDEAGAALLADAGIAGTSDELRAAAHDFAGHALALSLLAGFLKLLHDGKIGERSRIRRVIDDKSGHDQARRVVEAFDKEWLTREPALRAIMLMVGLFDRPAQADWIKALRAEPVIEEFAEAVVDLDDSAWRAAIVRLREVRLLDPEDSLSPDAIDAHPLVREWFGERLKNERQSAWRKAHGRIYEHLRDTTKEGDTPTLEDLGPLYQAIGHGCRAGRHQDVLDNVYANRICRRRPDGRPRFYAMEQLGAHGSDVAAMAWFFDQPYATPAAALATVSQSWVLAIAAFGLRAQGRFAEALESMRTGLGREENVADWSNAAISASNLSETELLLGKVGRAVTFAERSVAHAERSEDGYSLVTRRARLADALHAAGRHNEAKELFFSAEGLQAKVQLGYAVLYSLSGYQYCDLLLSEGERHAARDRANKAQEWTRADAPLVTLALDNLTLGRSHLGLAVTADKAHQPGGAREDARKADLRLEDAVEQLRAARRGDFIPRGLLARAAFRRQLGDWDRAGHDLDEVLEFAESGPMRLFLCDMAIERARIAFAQIEAFAPLNGMLEKDNPPPPKELNDDQKAKLKAEAEKQIEEAHKLIKQCGYHRRDEELAELKDVFAGKRTFASLPPRV
ncbi:MAG: toll/interleukin-1 receptor domain-containing protein [Xanthobacteraceae bacterium]